MSSESRDDSLGLQVLQLQCIIDAKDREIASLRTNLSMNGQVCEHSCVFIKQNAADRMRVHTLRTYMPMY